MFGMIQNFLKTLTFRQFLKNPHKNYHYQPARSIQYDIIKRAGSRGIKTLVKFINRSDCKNNQKGADKPILS